MNELYTPKQVSEYLDMPTSTLRHYAARFREYLSPHANKRRRKYTNTDLDVIQKIKTLSSDGVPLDDIGAQLAEMPIDHEPIEEKTSDTTALLGPALRREFADTRSISREILERLERIEERQLKQEQEERSRSFWDRIRGK